MSNEPSWRGVLLDVRDRAVRGRDSCTNRNAIEGEFVRGAASAFDRMIRYIDHVTEAAEMHPDEYPDPEAEGRPR